MIPELNKTYAISCLGPFEYNQYSGPGIFTGEIDIIEEIVYGFKIRGTKETCFFTEDEILGELK
jgi:hypothetical protein